MRMQPGQRLQADAELPHGAIDIEVSSIIIRRMKLMV